MNKIVFNFENDIQEELIFEITENFDISKSVIFDVTENHIKENRWDLKEKKNSSILNDFIKSVFNSLHNNNIISIIIQLEQAQKEYYIIREEIDQITYNIFGKKEENKMDEDLTLCQLSIILK